MTQTVFDNGMTAHVWAQQNQPQGRSNNGNFYFEGQNLFSYGTHYVVGYVLHPAPGQSMAPLYLVNGDSSSMTTSGKHKPAAYRAVPGRALTCANLTHIARELDSICYRYAWKEASRNEESGNRAPYLMCGYMPETITERRKGIKRIKAALLLDFPGQDVAESILAHLGARDAVKEAATLATKAAKQEASDKAAQAAKELNQNARAAKYYASKVTPQEAAQEVRDLLRESAESGSSYHAEQKEHEARESSREYYRAAKAAKAKGWTRIAKACRDRYNAARAELKSYDQQRARWQERAAIAAHVETIRQAPEHITLSHGQGDGSTESEMRRFEALARDHAALSDALLHVEASPYCAPRFSLDFQKAMGAAHHMATLYREKAGAIKQELQAERRAKWLAGEDSSTGHWHGNRLEDSEGGALLRAEQVERDDSGAITGGTLRTSWHATVPLAHAIRAFQFLKLCRESGKSWAANGRTIKVGHFRIDSVDTRGNFVAGCHRINWQEVSRLAALLGVAELESNDTALETRGA